MLSERLLHGLNFLFEVRIAIINLHLLDAEKQGSDNDKDLICHVVLHLLQTDPVENSCSAIGPIAYDNLSF